MTISELENGFILLIASLESKQDELSNEKLEELKGKKIEFDTDKKGWHKEFGKNESIDKLSEKYSHLLEEK